MITLRDLAEEMRDEYGDTYDEALTVVTTYAAQLDVPGTGEGGQCPDVEIDSRDADHIRRAYEAGTAADRARE